MIISYHIDFNVINNICQVRSFIISISSMYGKENVRVSNEHYNHYHDHCN